MTERFQQEKVDRLELDLKTEILKVREMALELVTQLSGLVKTQHEMINILAERIQRLEIDSKGKKDGT